MTYDVYIKRLGFAHGYWSVYPTGQITDRAHGSALTERGAEKRAAKAILAANTPPRGTRYERWDATIARRVLLPGGLNPPPDAGVWP